MIDNLIQDEDYERKKHIVLLALITVLILWSAIDAYDYFAWFMLTLPSVIMVLVLSLTYKKFQFTTLTYIMVFAHIIILLLGAKYTYAGNPLFLLVQEVLNHSRNNFDRVGHFMQGFAPLFMVKEYMLRRGYMKRSKFFYLILFCFILAISATWELLEFLTALISNKPAIYILSLQGDIWDSQWDMIMALVGAVVSLLLFGKLHDKKIEAMKEKDSLNDIKVKLL